MPSRTRSRRSRARGSSPSQRPSASSPTSRSRSCTGIPGACPASPRGAAEALGCPAPEVAEIRAAGLVHDVGRVAVPNGIWDKPGPLNAGEWERVRLHPYYTERVLERSAVLAPLAVLAGSHHERIDGSGYHRGATAAQLGTGARVLAAADVYDALTHDRPYRGALSAAAARTELGEMVVAGRLDKRAVDGVLEAAGAAALDVRQGYPAGLTEREVEVLRLVAQGADEQGDRERARDHREDGGPPRGAHLREDRCLDARRGGAVRDAPRPRGLTRDGEFSRWQKPRGA